MLEVINVRKFNHFTERVCNFHEKNLGCVEQCGFFTITPYAQLQGLNEIPHSTVGTWNTSPPFARRPPALSGGPRRYFPGDPIPTFDVGTLHFVMSLAIQHQTSMPAHCIVRLPWRPNTEVRCWHTAFSHIYMCKYISI